MATPRRKTGGCEQRQGAGGVTEVQIAFLVDCYLRDRGYAKTMREFRVEASSVLAPCKAEASLKMMSLGDILNDYVVLKEQILTVQSEKAKMESFVATVKDMVSSYEGGAARCSTPGTKSGPPPTTPAAPIPHPVSKRKTSPRGQEAPMLDITNTGLGSKRIRHCPVVPSKPAPFTPARQTSVDPKTPQQFGLPFGSGGLGFQSSEFRSPTATTAHPGSCELSKSRSKRQQAKPATIKCKSLDFTIGSEPIRHKDASAAAAAAAAAAKNNNNSDEKASSGQPVDKFCEELFTTEPLSSIDDILGTSLDGSSFSELMNSMMADDLIQEISSPSPTRELDSVGDDDCGFVAEVICVEDDEGRRSKLLSPSKSPRKTYGDEENTPPGLHT